MIEQSVPKPSSRFDTTADEISDVIPVVNHAPKPDGSGTLDSSPLAEACKRAQDAGVAIVADLGEALARRDRSKVLTPFRRILFPARRPGRRPKETITAAHRDWKNGVRSLALYRAHIPGWERHSHYRRQSEARALMDTIRTRERREQERKTRKLGSASPAGGPVESEVKRSD